MADVDRKVIDVEATYITEEVWRAVLCAPTCTYCDIFPPSEVDRERGRPTSASDDPDALHPVVPLRVAPLLPGHPALCSASGQVEQPEAKVDPGETPHHDVHPVAGHGADNIGTMTFSRQAETAIRHHCRLSIETMHPRFGIIDPAGFSVVLTVNSGYE